MKNINLSLDLPLSGEFTLRRRNANTNEVIQEVGPFSNLITNRGLNQIGTSGGWATHCYVGTGTVPPSESDTTMSAYKTTSNSLISTLNTPGSAPDWICRSSRTFVFNAGTISSNITEVGVGWAVSPVNSLWSRELIVDSGGNPIAITVLPTEILEVVYTLSLRVPQSDFSGSFTLNSIVYNYIGRAQSASAWRVGNDTPMYGPYMGDVRIAGATISASIAGEPTGSFAAGSPSSNNLAYVDNSKARSCVTSFALSQGNGTGGVQVFTIYPRGSTPTDCFVVYRYQVRLDKPIPKTNLNTMSFTWSHSWDRYTPPGP